MDISPYWPYIAIVFLLACSAFFSGSEIAYAAANKMRLKKAAEGGRRSSKIAYSISQSFDRALSAILIGNNLVNIAASSVGTLIAIDLVGPQGAVYATAVMTLLVLIFGEIVPKVVAKEHADGFATGVAPLLQLLVFLLWPAVWLVQKVVGLIARLWGGTAQLEDEITEEELVSIIETVEDEGVIDEERSELLQSAIEFDETTAQEILIPRVDMMAYDIEDGLDALIELVENSPHSRIPVYQRSLDNIIGVLYVNHLLKKLIDTREIDVRELLMPPCFIHKSMRLNALLAELKRRKTHLAIVNDEYGGTMGMLTMEDVLEELVGDIWDESDEIYSDFTLIGEELYEVSGDLGIYDFFEELEMDEDDFESNYASVGGWAIDRLGGYPEVGDSFMYENLRITVTEMDDLRITTLQVQILPKPEEED